MDKMLDFRGTYLDSKKNEPLLILDLGSLDVNGSYREYFHISPWTYRGVDTVAGENVDIVLKDPYDWQEIRSDTVDVLISGQAFEHIEFFWLTMLEIARVLKPEGLGCIIAPSGGYEHRYPVDCWRFYPDGFAALARFARLEVLEVATQWKPDPKYTDDSNNWQDTMVVFKKASRSRFDSWRRQLRLRLLHRMLIRALS
jgi:SAM-dependent methyltransferase